MIQVEALIGVLEGARAPMHAAEIAWDCGLRASHETARRRVREAVEAARLSGHQVCADPTHGYWLAIRAEEFRAYLERRRDGNVRDLARVSKAKRGAKGDQPGLFSGGTDDRQAAFRK